MFYSFSWPNFIFWFTLLLDILGNMCIVIISCPVSEVINFKIKLFFYRTKKSGQKCKYFKNEKSFQHEMKNIFDYFSRTFIEVNKKNFFGRRESNFK